MVNYYIQIKLEATPFLTAAFQEFQETTLSILRVSNITMYGTGKVRIKKKVYLVIMNAPAFLVLLLMIKGIFTQEVPILRFTSGMEILSRPLWVFMLVASLELYNTQMVNFIRVVRMVTSVLQMLVPWNQKEKSLLVH